MLCFSTANKRPMPPGAQHLWAQKPSLPNADKYRAHRRFILFTFGSLLFIGAWRSFLVGDRGFTLNTLLLIYMAELNRKYGHNNEKAHARTSVVSRSAAWTFG